MRQLVDESMRQLVDELISKLGN